MLMKMEFHWADNCAIEQQAPTTQNVPTIFCILSTLNIAVQ